MTAPDSGRAGTRAPKILIVDDDLTFGDLTRRRLSRLGYDVKLHGGSSGTLELLMRGAFDLLILDVRMPGLDGPELMKMIRSLRDKELKVMFYSSSDNQELRRLCEEHGVDAYLNKSATTAEFELRVRDLLGVRAAAWLLQVKPRSL